LAEKWIALANLEYLAEKWSTDRGALEDSLEGFLSTVNETLSKINEFADILRMFQPSLKLTYFFIPSCPTLLPFFLMNDGALIY
jgi:hypothetical protein